MSVAGQQSGDVAFLDAASGCVRVKSVEQRRIAGDLSKQSVERKVHAALNLARAIPVPHRVTGS